MSKSLIWLRNHWQLSSLIFVLVILLLASLTISWSLLDDGITIIVAKRISLVLTHLDWQGLANIFLEKDSGRFRPFYFIANWLLFLVFKTNVHLFYLVHSALLITTALIIYRLIYVISNNRIGSLIGSLLFAASSLNVENWFRLGPQEPWVGLFLAVILYSIYQILESEKTGFTLVWTAAFSTVLLYLTKETGLVLLPFVLLLLGFTYLSAKKQLTSTTRKLLILFLLNGLLALLVVGVVIYLRSSGYYSSNYSVGSHSLWNTFIGYLQSLSNSVYPFFWIFVLEFFIRNTHKFLNEEKIANKLFIWQSFCLILMLLNIFILLPWGIPLDRYLLPTLIPFALFWGLESSVIINFLAKRWKNVAIVGVSLYFVIFFYNNFYSYLNYYDVTSKGTQNTAKILSDLAKIAPPGAGVKINAVKSDATIEPVLESGYHLANFYHRPDLQIGYLESSNTASLAKDTFILSAFVSSDWHIASDSALAMQTQKLQSYDFTNIRYLTIPIKELILNTITFHLGSLFDYLRGANIRVENSHQSWGLYKTN